MFIFTNLHTAAEFSLMNSDPPWPKHPCTSSDDSSIRRTVRDFNLEQLFPTSDRHPEASPQSEKAEPSVDSLASLPKPNLKIPDGRNAGWNPLLLSQTMPTGCGIVIDGSELLEDTKNIQRKLIQVDIQDTFQEARDGLVYSYSMAMNPNRLISVLTKNVVFIRRVSETTYELSTISITKDDEFIHFTFQMKENRSLSP